MILLIDIGNSRLKWAASDGAAVQSPEAIDHGARPAEVLKTRELPASESVWISHVMGAEHEAAVAAAVGAACGMAPRFVRTQEEREGLRVAYAEPLRLGVDRWLCLLALWTQSNSAFCVVNAGTALTFDAVDDGGQHLGGLIAPGLVTAQTAIAGATRFEIRPQGPKFSSGLGTDTESCVRQGALYACAGLVERAGRQASGTHYITGGDAPALLPHVGRGWEWKPHLVLEGLLAFARSE
jgi:type III pantothenate kinase